MFPSKPAKYLFRERVTELLEGAAGEGREVRLLEIGSGTSEIAHDLVGRFPFVRYVGIEPDPASVQRARERLKDNARAEVVHGLGYGKGKHPALERPFDVVFSLSVLEHVKRLETFIDFSVGMARPGGIVAHLYDLGHALHPSSPKEWLQTRICGSALLRFVPEHKVARYLATSYVRGLLEKGCDIDEVTFNNMPNLVGLLKSHMTEDLMREVVAFERANSGKVADLAVREKLFPSICFWAKRRAA